MPGLTIRNTPLHDWNGVRSTAGASFPGSPAAGDVCNRTDLGAWYFYDGAAWHGVAAPAAPAPLPPQRDLLAWWRADDQSYNDGDAVTICYDSMGHNNTLTPTVGSAPTFKTNILNGHSIIRFNGSNSLDGAALAGLTLVTPTTQPDTLVLIVKHANAITGNETWYDGVSGNGARHRLTRQTGGSPVELYSGGVPQPSIAGPTDTAWHVWRITWKGASTKFWLDGVLQATTTVGTSGMGNITLGMRQSAASGAVGDFAELLAYNHELLDSENAVGASYVGRYGLSGW